MFKACAVSRERALATHGEEQLGLDVLVEVVQAGHCRFSKAAQGLRTIRSTVADDQIGQIAFEVRNDLLRRCRLGDVALQLGDARQRRHRLEIDSDNDRRGCLVDDAGRSDRDRAESTHLSFWVKTWLQLPGAAQRSTTRLTLLGSSRPNCSSSCKSLYADRARYDSALAAR